MKKPKIIHFKIPKWHDKQHAKTKTFFRLDTDIFQDHKVAQLGPTAFTIWIYLLSTAARRCSDRASILLLSCSNDVSTRSYHCIKALHKLSELGLIEILDDSLSPLDKIREDKIREEEIRGDSKGKLENLPPRKSQTFLVDLWNENCGGLAKVKKVGASRQRKIKSIERELEKPEWLEVIKKIEKSKFCNGANDRSWQATFDWLIQGDTFAKVLEGKYDNRTKGKEQMTLADKRKISLNYDLIEKIKEEKRRGKTRDVN